MKTFKLKSLLTGIGLALSIAIFMTSCEQDTLKTPEELIDENTEHDHTHEDACSSCALFTDRAPDEIVDIQIVYKEGEAPTIEQAARYGETLVYGGDVVLTESYSGELALRGTIISDFSKLWSNSTIPYVFGDGLSTSEKSKVLAAINKINETTNLCVTERNDESDFIRFERRTAGCYVFGIGNIGGVQPVNLGLGCVSQGVIIHEILHKAGFYHEQNRPDRDDFITVNFDNLENVWKSQFRSQGGEAASGTYDFASIMHYPQFNSQLTINDSQPAFFINNPNDLPPGLSPNRIGYFDDMSNTDRVSVNTLYPNACSGCPNSPDAPTFNSLRIEDIKCNAARTVCLNNSGDRKQYQLRKRNGTFVENKTTTKNFRVFRDLSPNKRYKFRVRKKCGTSGAFGPWSSYKNFRTTPCE